MVLVAVVDVGLSRPLVGDCGGDVGIIVGGPCIFPIRDGECNGDCA